MSSKFAQHICVFLNSNAVILTFLKIVMWKEGLRAKVQLNWRGQNIKIMRQLQAAMPVSIMPPYVAVQKDMTDSALDIIMSQLPQEE